jgi:probable phosphomutase (TIGR03848 family)
MSIILFIRHGTNDFVGKRLAGRLPDVHLNEHGRQQAQVVAQALCRLPFKAIYSSPLDRAVETAQPLADALGLPVNLQPGLLEIDFGEWQGLSIGRLRRRKIWKTVQENPASMRFPGGESFAEAQSRLAQSVDAIVAGHDKMDMLACFSHSDAIRLLVAYALGLPLDNFQRLSIDTATMTLIGWGGPVPFLGPVNMYLTPGMAEDLQKMFQPPKPHRVRKPKETDAISKK